MIVVDASAVTDLLVVAEPDAALAAALRAEELHAPAVIDFEVASSLRGLLIGAKLDIEQANNALDQFASLHVRRYSMTMALKQVIALGHNFTAYDAAYVVLAQALGAPLLTSDAKFVNARRVGVDVRVTAAA